MIVGGWPSQTYRQAGAGGVEVGRAATSLLEDGVAGGILGKDTRSEDSGVGGLHLGQVIVRVTRCKSSQNNLGKGDRQSDEQGTRAV